MTKSQESKNLDEYIAGAKARALKEDFRPLATSSWQEGFNSLQEILGPIEQDIFLLTLKYKAVAEKRIKELEETARAQAVAASATGSTGSTQ